MKLVATHRKAYRDYKIIEKYEAGIALKGGEVKSLRMGKCSLDGSFCRVEKGELIAYNIHIPEFEQSSYFKHNPRRERKLLLKKRELKRLSGLLTQRGYTIIPLRMYFNDRGWAKLEVALCKGMRKYEKRRKIKDGEARREVEREISRFYRR